MQNILFVTSNQGKLKDAAHILGTDLEMIHIELDEIQDLSIEFIVEKKAQAAYALVQKPLIVDDSGVYFHAWNGFPGPMVKFLDKAGGVPLVLKMLAHEQDRGITLKACVGFHDGDRVHTFTGEFESQIAFESRGTQGWSWDTIFVDPDSQMTFAELTTEEKNRISHRRKAFEQLKQYLDLLKY